MATLTLQVENPSILEHLKGLLSVMKGVKILHVDDSLAKKVKHEEFPNAMTMAAIREIESGKDAGVVKMDSLADFISSLD